MHGSIARLAKACRRRGRSPEDAEDLIQDALLRLEEFRHKGEGAEKIKNPEAWLEEHPDNAFAWEMASENVADEP